MTHVGLSVISSTLGSLREIPYPRCTIIHLALYGHCWLRWSDREQFMDYWKSVFCTSIFTLSWPGSDPMLPDPLHRSVQRIGAKPRGSTDGKGVWLGTESILLTRKFNCWDDTLNKFFERISENQESISLRLNWTRLWLRGKLMWAQYSHLLSRQHQGLHLLLLKPWFDWAWDVKKGWRRLGRLFFALAI